MTHLRLITTNSLIEIGVGDDVTRSDKAYGKLSQVSKGWAQNNAFLKKEKHQTNIGLGKGKALKIFNSNIINFKKVGGK